MLSYSERGKLGAIKSAKTVNDKKQQRILEYNKNPKLCKHCNQKIDYEKRVNVFCNKNCSATFNNLNRANMKRWNCLYCDKRYEQHNHQNQKYCNTDCSNKHKRQLTLERYLESNGQYFPKGAVKDYIMEEQNCKCSICDMSNIWHNNALVFVLDHIDGNSENNKRNNLRCVCPNCDSQLDTYKSKNRGNGRHNRRQRYKEGKSF